MAGKEPVHIDVWGCCTSRDIFAIAENDNVKVVKYYQLPIFTQFDKSEDMLANRMTIDEVDAHKSNYANRMAKAELNREALEGLLESDSEWLVLDVRYYTYLYYEAVFNGVPHYYSRVIVNADEVVRSVEKKGLDIESFNKLPLNEEDVDFKLDEACDFFKKRYGKNIILVQVRESDRILDENGMVVPRVQGGREKALLMEDDLFNRLLDKLDCYYIKCPENVASETYHKWGHRGHGTSVHYTYDYYEYANRCIEIILSGDKDWLKKCDRLFVELSSFYNALLFGEKASLQNVVGRMEARLRVAKTPEAVHDVIDFAEKIASDPKNAKIEGRVHSAIADIYLDNKLLKNEDYLAEAVKHLKIGLESGVSKDRYRLFDVLWEIGTKKSYKEAVGLVRSKAGEGDPEAMYRMGRAFRFGRGVRMDKDVACRLLGDASVGCRDARSDYYAMVWNLKKPEHFERLYSFLIELENRNSLENYYLGEMLRTGKGCTKDLDSALLYLSDATDLPRARRAIFETMWDYNDEDRDVDAFGIANLYALEGDATSMRCLSWAYC